MTRQDMDRKHLRKLRWLASSPLGLALSSRMFLERVLRSSGRRKHIRAAKPALRS